MVLPTRRGLGERATQDARVREGHQPRAPVVDPRGVAALEQARLYLRGDRGDGLLGGLDPAGVEHGVHPRVADVPEATDGDRPQRPISSRDLLHDALEGDVGGAAGGRGAEWCVCV